MLRQSFLPLLIILLTLILSPTTGPLTLVKADDIQQTSSQKQSTEERSNIQSDIQTNIDQPSTDEPTDSLNPSSTTSKTTSKTTPDQVNIVQHQEVQVEEITDTNIHENDDNDDNNNNDGHVELEEEDKEGGLQQEVEEKKERKLPNMKIVGAAFVGAGGVAFLARGILK
mmetsp:Transcript_19911/g.41598  ORF Transcript_19911/g.41598 Transcript_19911/m.41598 type:complete len:170 (+) Transcript_19911:97-606(+)|eukprot:CAMPEP_0118645432 /NCGR_PEP_ID=MMETSP0785-20121206/7503_1 /TAXON_ID=91992 /ORGANISM="Bolidomonas pacifica, Strain CCMP 1866" /LENGTH=169 /DNA_ID=CAMNT_0006537325 /DNA_START=82 /DNA_END=591 /DNA_ORIENTATION=+